MEVPKEIQPLRGLGYSVVVRSPMKYWRLRYVCVDFDPPPHPPPPHAHLSSAPAPTANSHQSRDFTLRVRDLPSFRFTHCILLSQGCYCSPCLVLFINLLSLKKTTSTTKSLSLTQLPDKSSVKTDAGDFWWTAEGLTDRKALLLLCSGVT